MDARPPLPDWHQEPLGAFSPDRPMVRRWLDAYIRAIDGSIAVTHGRTRFFDPLTGATRGEFDNAWVLRFGPDGRCAEFHEWYAGRPEHDPSRAMPDGGAEAPA